MYPAKLILFGEYTVLLGGRALAMPLQQFKAYWDRSVLETDTRISGFFEYLLTNDSLKDLFDAAKMKSDLGAGLVFQSDIPLGYGLGSSGALCAATYDTYALTKSTDLHLLKKQLADMEAHFHGASSGTDPLICYLNQTLLLEKNNIKVLSDFSLDRTTNWQFFLLDVGFPRPHSDLIKWFVAQSEQSHYRDQVEANLLPQVEEVITALMQKQQHLCFDLMHEISLFQVRYFQPMIPDALRPLWMDGLSSDWFKLKICGAGGGGFFLGMTNDLERLETQIDFSLILVQ